MRNVLGYIGSEYFSQDRVRPLIVVKLCFVYEGSHVRMCKREEADGVRCRVGGRGGDGSRYQATNQPFFGSGWKPPIEHGREQLHIEVTTLCYHISDTTMAFSLKKVFGSIKSNPHLAQSAVGIDIGRGSVKVVELERTEDGPVLKTYGEIQIAPYTDAPIGTTVDFDASMLEKVIVDVFREAGVSAQHGVLALPLSAGFVTVIELVAATDENLESRIPVEARKYVPIPLKEITLDWTVVGTPTPLENEKVQYRVLLVALPNETLLQYTQLLSSIELAHQPMELAVFSAVRCLPAAQTGTAAVLDMGASVAKLAIYQAGTLTAIHRFTAGGGAVTHKLAELLQIDVAAAEELKRSGGVTTEHEADIRRIMAAVYDSSLQEVRRIVQHYESVHQLEPIPIYLAGGMGAAAGMRPYVSDVLQRPVEPFFPFAVVGYPAFMEDMLRTIGPTFASSVGAALRHLQ